MNQSKPPAQPPSSSGAAAPASLKQVFQRLAAAGVPLQKAA